MSRAQLTSTVEQNSAGAAAPVVAGKNAIINGGMDIWQRGTTTTNPTNTSTFVADRMYGLAGASGYTYTRQSSGLTGFQYCLRVARDSGSTSANNMWVLYAAETSDSFRFAGQTITFSFYARKGANFSGSSSLLTTRVFYGTGTDQNPVSGFTGGATFIDSSATLTTSWQRFTFTGTVSSTATQIGWGVFYFSSGTAGAADYYEITGVQLEIGAVATPFSRAGGTLQGELALCMRYYQRWVDGNGNTGVGTGVVVSASRVNDINFRFIVPMRTYPAFSYTGTIAVYDGFSTNVTSVAASSIGALGMYFDANCANSGLTTGRAAGVTVSAGTGNYLEFSAEL